MIAYHKCKKREKGDNHKSFGVLEFKTDSKGVTSFKCRYCEKEFLTFEDFILLIKDGEVRVK